MTTEISAATLREWLYDGDELALLDVREPGQMILGHILFSAPLPYSRFEIDLIRLAPNPSVRMVLCDEGDGVAQHAATRAVTLGYTSIHILTGGVNSWAKAGHTLYQGVNVPSKAFGELIEHASETPRMTAAQIAEMQRSGVNMTIVDGRPLSEYTKMSIPGADCCPNGELAMRASAFAPDPETTIIVNCAGRTRSIIGAQTLIDMKVPNPVFAMENGTQGWVLAGLQLDRGLTGQIPVAPQDLQIQRSNAAALAARHGVQTASITELADWFDDPMTTVYLLDVRTDEERASDPADRKTTLSNARVVHAPGGQLVQATDQWIGVRHAKVILLDTEAVRAPVSASWLRRLGHEAFILEGGLDALQGVSKPQSDATVEALPTLSAMELSEAINTVNVLDLRASAEYRAGHIAGAIWANRARLPKLDGDVVLIAEDPAVAALAAQDLLESGASSVRLFEAGVSAWTALKLPVEATPDIPADADRIDFQSFTAGRHDGNEAASRQYLQWEIELVDQLDADERAVFRI